MCHLFVPVSIQFSVGHLHLKCRLAFFIINKCAINTDVGIALVSS
jgi:hypothetical protein